MFQFDFAALILKLLDHFAKDIQDECLEGGSWDGAVECRKMRNILFDICLDLFDALFEVSDPVCAQGFSSCPHASV